MIQGCNKLKFDETEENLSNKTPKVLKDIGAMEDLDIVHWLLFDSEEADFSRGNCCEYHEFYVCDISIEQQKIYVLNM